MLQSSLNLVLTYGKCALADSKDGVPIGIQVHICEDAFKGCFIRGVRLFVGPQEGKNSHM